MRLATFRFSFVHNSFVLQQPRKYYTSNGRCPPKMSSFLSERLPVTSIPMSLSSYIRPLSLPLTVLLLLLLSVSLALCVIKSQNGCISFTNICRLRLPKRVEERGRLWATVGDRGAGKCNIEFPQGLRGHRSLLTNLRRQDQRGPRARARRLYKFNNTK